MLYYALVFLILALVAGFFGFSDIALPWSERPTRRLTPILANLDPGVRYMF